MGLSTTTLEQIAGLSADALADLDSVRLKGLGLKRQFRKRLKAHDLRTLGDIARIDGHILFRACRGKAKRITALTGLIYARLAEAIPDVAPAFDITTITEPTASCQDVKPNTATRGADRRDETVSESHGHREMLDVLSRISAMRWTTPMTKKHHANWRKFARWCAEGDRISLPASPETVAEFLASQNGLGSETMRIYTQTVDAVHKIYGFPFDKVAPVIVNVRRAARPSRAKPVPPREVTHADIAMMFPESNADITLTELLERAIVFLGYATGHLASELACLGVESLQFTPTGMILTTPAFRKGYYWNGHVHVLTATNDPFCPVRACRAWLDASGITERCLFRRVTGTTVGRTILPGEVVTIMRKRIEAAGLDKTGITGRSFYLGWKTRMKTFPPGSYSTFRATPKATTSEAYCRENPPVPPVKKTPPAPPTFPTP